MQKITRSNSQILIITTIMLIILSVWFFGFSFNADVNTRFEESENLQVKTNIKTFGYSRFKFAFCGDPHVRSMQRNHFSILKELIPAYQINFVIFPGDLTLQGKANEYFMFKDLADSLEVPYLTTIGNHDLYDNGWAIYKQLFGPSHYSVEVSNSIFIFLDTADKTLGELQIRWLANVLETSAKGKDHIFVITHTPIFSEQHEISHLSNDLERDKLIELFILHKVDYVLEGHYHGFVALQFNGVNYITSGSFGEEMLENDGYHFLVFTINGQIVTYSKVDITKPILYQDDIL